MVRGGPVWLAGRVGWLAEWRVEAGCMQAKHGQGKNERDRGRQYKRVRTRSGAPGKREM